MHAECALIYRRINSSKVIVLKIMTRSNPVALTHFPCFSAGKPFKFEPPFGNELPPSGFDSGTLFLNLKNACICCHE